MTDDFPMIDENDKNALMRERGRLIERLAAVEQVLNEKHGMHLATV